MPKTRNTPMVSRRTLVIALVTVVVLLAAALVGGEAYARHQVANCMSSQFEREMDSKIDVGFGTKPVLLTWMDGSLPHLNVKSDGAKFGPAVGMEVEADLNDVQLADNGGGTVGSSSAQVTWSNAGISETLKGLVSQVQSSEATGDLTMGMIGGIAQMQVRPEIQDSKVDVQMRSAEVLGIGIPNDLAQGVVDMLSEGFQNYPLGLEPTAVKVTDAGVEVELEGGHTELPPPPEGAANTSC